MLKKNSANKINSILGPEVDVDGDVKVVGSILIYGKVNGNVTASGTVRTAKSSHIEGNIESQDCFISGKVDGDVKVLGKTTLEKNCILNGNLVTAIVVIEEGATFEGICNMVKSNDVSNNPKTLNIDSKTSELNNNL
tara:strand:+ start:1035 stop:1445 length:411 start_codon:yes stop_codon:yes gene_type:complete